MTQERDPNANVFGSEEPTLVPPPEPAPVAAKHRDTGFTVALAILGVAFVACALALAFAIYRG